jgi:hypothetical protein
VAKTQEDLLIKIQADTGNASESIALLAKQLGRLELSMVSVAKSTKQTSQNVSGFGAAMIAVSAGIAIAREAFGKIEGVIDATVGAFKHSEDGAIRLAGTLAKIGAEDVRGVVEDFKKFAKQLQDTTTVEDDHAIALINIATASGLSAEKSKQLIQVSADLAATGRGDLDSAFQALLKSYKGNVAGLAILAPELAGMDPVLAKTGEAVRRLQENLGGLAQNELFTSAGTMTQFKNILGDLGEETGRLISNFLGLDGTSKKMTESLKSIVLVIKELADNVPRVGESVSKFAKALSEINFSKMASDMGDFINQFKIIIGLFAGLTLASTVIVFGSLGSTIAALAGTAGFGMLVNALIPTIMYLKSAAVAAGTLLLALAGYAFAAAGVLTLVAGIEILFRNLTSLQGLADLLVAGFGGVVLVFANFAQGVINLGQGILQLVGITTNALNFLGLFDGLAQKTADSVVRLNTGLTGTALSEIGKMLDKLKSGASEAEKLGAALSKGWPKGGPKGAPVQTAEEKKIMETRVKNLQDLRTQNALLDLENRRSEITTIDYLNQKNQIEIQALRLKFKSGELGGLGTKELEKQIELMNIKNGLAVAQEPAQEFQVAAKSGNDLAKTISGAMTGGLSGVGGMITGMMSGAGAVMAAADGVVGSIQGVIDFIPKILNSVANVFSSLADLPLKILDGVKNLMGSLVKFVTDLIPNLFSAVPDILFSIIDTIFSKLPAAIMNLVKSLPDLIMGFIDRIPEIVTELISGLISAVPTLVISLATSIIGNIPKIVIALAKAVAITIPKAIIKGIMEGLKQIAETIKGMFGGGLFGKKKQKLEFDTKSITESMKKAASALTGETSKLFKVMDLTGGDTKSAEKTKENISAIEAAGTRSRDWLMQAWDKVVAGFGNLMTWFGEVWHQFLRSLKEVWMGIFQMFSDIFNVIKFMVNGVITALFEAMDFLMLVGDAIVQGVTDGLAAAGSFFNDLGGQISEGFWEGLQGLGAFFTNMFDSLKLGNLFEKLFKVDYKGRGYIEQNVINTDIPFMNFAKGGMVPGNAQVTGDSLMNDRVLAMISPGEAIIPRSKMNDPFLSGLIRGVLDGTITPPKFKMGGVVGSVVEKTKETGGQVADAAQVAAQQVQDLIASLNPSQITAMVREKILKEMIPAMLSANKFHTGGIIGGSGDVPILGQAGEFVMQRSAVSGIGQGNLAQMNKTGSSSVQGNTSNVYNIDIKVDAKTAPDEKFIRGTLLPILKEELRRASLDGQRVLFQSGVRA